MSGRKSAPKKSWKLRGLKALKPQQEIYLSSSSIFGLASDVKKIYIYSHFYDKEMCSLIWHVSLVWSRVLKMKVRCVVSWQLDEQGTNPPAGEVASFFLKGMAEKACMQDEGCWGGFKWVGLWISKKESKQILHLLLWEYTPTRYSRLTCYGEMVAKCGMKIGLAAKTNLFELPLHIWHIKGSHFQREALYLLSLTTA